MKSTAQAVTQSHPQVITSELGITLMKIAFRVSFVLTVCFIGLVGVWSIAAVVGGVAEAGGGLNFVSSWFGAVTGK